MALAVGIAVASPMQSMAGCLDDCILAAGLCASDPPCLAACVAEPVICGGAAVICAIITCVFG